MWALTRQRGQRDGRGATRGLVGQYKKAPENAEAFKFLTKEEDRYSTQCLATTGPVQLKR
jgi:hypothetical protein